MSNRLKLFSLFAGVGAPEMALKRLGIPLEIVGYSEIDKYAIQSYKAIHGEDIPNLGDIKQIERLPKCNLLFYGSPCLTGDTLVMTSLGYKQIVDVNIGDEVLGHDGAFHKVTDFLEQGIKPTYKIKAMGMDSIRCTDNHKFYVRKMYRKYLTVNGKRKNERSFKEPEWVECKDLDKSYYMGMPINNKSELPNWSGVEYSRWKHKHNELPLDNPDFWYIVGRFLGDDWVRDRKDRNCQYSSTVICCGKSEINELESKMAVFNYTKVEDRTVFRLQISNKELATFLSNFGHGAGEKFVPGFVMNLPKDLLKSFIDGYLESDGCYTQNRYKGTSISKKLIYGLTQCIAKVYNRPFSIYHTKRKPTCIIEGREVNQKDNFQFTFQDKARKQDKAFYENGYIWYPIQSIESTGLEEPVYDITVEDCHSFVANNCITHNCQDFSIAGKQRGLINEQGEQTRSGLLLEVERLVETAKANNELPEILLMENVKNLVSKKFKPDFDRWLQKLDSLGYNNYYSVLNAKDYGVPQNRERVFVVSIRKDIDKRGYTFPEKMPLTKRLKDILENEVDEKFYLNEKIVNRFKFNSNLGTNIVGTTLGDECTRHGQRDYVYNPDKIMGALCATDYKQPKQIVEFPCIGASRGRNPENPSDRTTGSPTQQRLEINSQGLSNTLTTVQKDNLVVENRVIQIGNIVNTGNWNNPQRGRIYSSDGCSPTLNTCGGGGLEPKIFEGVRIRKLTPLECWRLMGFDDEDFRKAKNSGVSNSQLYKQAGNSIVTNVLYHIFRKLFIDYNK